MPSLVLVTVMEEDDLGALLTAWHQTGDSPIIVLEGVSTEPAGNEDGARDDFPIFPSLRNIFQWNEIHTRVALAVAENDAHVDALLAAARRVLGDFESRPNRFALTLPIGRVDGLQPTQG